MSVRAEFRQFIEDQLSGFGPVSIRSMFGGAGVYRDGLMFALIAGEVLYLKATDLNRADFDAENLKPFEYTAKGGSRAVMSYYRAPERCLDDPAEMTIWAGKAYAAALAAGTKKPVRR